MTEDLKYVEKINAMFASADDAQTDAERDAWLIKIQRLITKHNVTEAMLAEAAGDVKSDEIVLETIEFTGVIRSTWYLLACYVAEVNHARVITNTHARTRDGAHAYRSSVVGYRSDMDATLQLVNSLRAQGEAALATWWSDLPRTETATWVPMYKHKQRREFVDSFIHAVYAKLVHAAAQGQDDAVDAQVASGSERNEAGTSTALVLRTRDDRVSDAVGERFGKTRAIRSSKQSGGYNAHVAGANAGRRADVGQGKVGGGRRELR